MASNPPAALPDIGPDGIQRENPIIAYTEKIIEAEHLELKKYIEENYSKIRDVERELTNLTMEMKLTSGPKKAALEHMRKKIEISTEKIRTAKIKEEQARKAWEEATQAVKDEEAVKQKLCDDLNNLVHESNSTQHSRLEELKRRLEALNPNRASISSPQAQNSPFADASSTPAASPAVAVAVAESLSHQVNGVETQVANGKNQQHSIEGEGRGKKKVHLPGKGRGVGAVPKGRGPTTTGWTGSGFDVDGRN